MFRDTHPSGGLDSLVGAERGRCCGSCSWGREQTRRGWGGRRASRRQGETSSLKKHCLSGRLRDNPTGILAGGVNVVDSETTRFCLKNITLCEFNGHLRTSVYERRKSDRPSEEGAHELLTTP